MALSRTGRGTGGNNTTGTSHTVVPGSNMTPGTLGVLCIALDNAGSAGSTAAAPAVPITDSAGNVWTRRVDGIFDNGAASAGVEVAIYTAALGYGLTTSQNLVLSWIAGVSVVAKAWTLDEWSAAAGKIPAFNQSGAGTGATTGTPTITTASITSGNAVIGVGGVESADTWAGDADTSNGSWSTHQHTGFGTGTSGMSVTSQAKVVTGTATQTYNPTCTSADTCLAWIEIKEVNAYTLTAAQGSFALTGQASGGLYGRKVIAAQASFTLTGQAAALTPSWGIFTKVQAGKSGTASSGTTVSASFTNNVTQGNLVCVGVAFYDGGSTPPTLSVQDENGKVYTIEPNNTGTTNMTVCGWGSLAYLLKAPAGAGKTITATFDRTITFAGIWVDEFNPSIGQVAYDSGATASGTGALTTPSIPVNNSHELVYGLGLSDSVIGAVTGAWTGNEGGVQIGDDTEWILHVMSATAVGFGAGSGNHYNASGMSFKIVTANAYTLTAAQASFTLTGQTASLKVGRLLTAAQASFALTGEPAGLSRGVPMSAAQASFTLSGQAAGLVRTRIMPAAQASFIFTGEPATLLKGRTMTAAFASFTLTGEPAGLLAAKRLTAAQASFTLTGEPAALLRGRLLSAAQSTFSLTGEPANLLVGHRLAAVQASFALTGEPAALLRGRLLTSAFATFALSGQSAGLRWAHVLSAQQAAFILTGQPAALHKGGDITLLAGTGSFALTGEAATLLRGRLLSAATAAFALTGEAAALMTARILRASAGMFVLTGLDAGLVHGAAPPPVFITYVRDIGTASLSAKNQAHVSLVVNDNQAVPLRRLSEEAAELDTINREAIDL